MVLYHPACRAACGVGAFGAGRGVGGTWRFSMDLSMYLTFTTRLALSFDPRVLPP